MSGAIVWERSPSELADAIEFYGEQVLEKAKTVAASVAQLMEAAAKGSAPWQDQTGDARAGLTTVVIFADDLITITLYHTVPYGIFLEVCNGGKYRVILPTIVQFGPLFISMLQAMLSA